MSETKDNRKTCFIITPIGKDGSAIRRKMEGVIDAAINPVLKEYNFNDPKVSHRIQNSGSMTAEIIKGIYDSDLVIANLTDNNANVMYEVAIRHCAGKPIIHITEDIDTIPFDVNDHRCIQYTNDAMGVIELKDELRKKIEHIINNPGDQVSNPVLDHLGKTRIIEEPQDQIVSVADAIGELRNHVMALDNDIVDLKKTINKTSLNNSEKQAGIQLIYDNEKYLNSARKLSKKNNNKRLIDIGGGTY